MQNGVQTLWDMWNKSILDKNTKLTEQMEVIIKKVNAKDKYVQALNVIDLKFRAKCNFNIIYWIDEMLKFENASELKKLRDELKDAA